MDGSGKNIKEMLHFIQEPLIFKNMLQWNMISWSLDDWCNKLEDVELKFRLGKFIKLEEPQWENTTEIVIGTFKDFLQFENKTDWLYFDYKYLRDWLENISELKEDIQWKQFGFDNITYKDCTIWIGNKGAHTPCHIDTYGFNLVAQIYGRKQWLLFPPNENLLPTRIPYEESSIYSKINFFSPNYSQLKEVNVCKSIVLNPGDVLFVPRGWWHYVENLDTAISINTWIPLEVDAISQVDEAIVKILMNLLSSKTNSGNEENQSLQASSQLLNHCLNSHKEISKNLHNNETFDTNKFLEDHALTIKRLCTLSKQEFRNLITKKSERFHEEDDKDVPIESTSNDAFKKLLESITHPDVIALIKSKLLQK